MGKKTTIVSNSAIEYYTIEWSSGDLFECDLDLNKTIVIVESGLFQEKLNLGTKVEMRELGPQQSTEIPCGSKWSIKCLRAGKTFHFRIIESKSAERQPFKEIPLLEVDTLVKLHDSGKTWPELMKICEAVEANSIATHSPNFMNQLYSGVFPTTVVGEALLARTRTIISTLEAAPVFSFVEIELVNSLIKLIGWPEGEGVPVPGGTSANFMAVHCARYYKFPEAKQFGMPDVKVAAFASEDAHYCTKKACTVLGLGESAYHEVEADERGRMKPESLEKLLRKAKERDHVPMIVTATAGTTVKGAVDPISEIHEICKNYGAWLHIDGTWGGPLLFSKDHRQLLRDIEKADSVSLDTHKIFGSNATCSFFLVRHPKLLLDANDISGGEYLFHDGHGEFIDRGRLTWQCSRKADAFSFWVLWQSLGASGIGEYIDRLMETKNQIVEWIAMNQRLKLILQPEYLNICVKVLPPTPDCNERLWSRHVREVLRQQSVAFINYFEDQEHGSYLRLILANPWQDFERIRGILMAALEVGADETSSAA